MTMRTEISKVLDSIAPKWRWQHVFIYTFVCFLTFLPYMLAFSPGIVEVDTSFQIAMHLGYGYGTLENYESPFPVFDIRFMGALYSLGEALTHSARGGILAICLFQCVGFSAGIAAIACYLSKWNIPSWARLVLFLFMALDPIVPLAAVDVGKDGVFCVFFMFFVLCSMEMVRLASAPPLTTTSAGKGVPKRRIALIVAASVSGALASFSASKGFVMVIGCLFLVLLYALVKKRKRIAAQIGISAGTVMACEIAFILIVSPMLAVGLPSSSSTLREALGTPIQQATWAAKVSTISEEETRELNSLYDLELAKYWYLPESSDYTKFTMHEDATVGNALDMMRAYVTIGLSHPKEYLKSFVDLYDGFITVGTVDSLMLPRFMPNGEVTPLQWNGNTFRFPGDNADAIEAVQNGWVTYSHGNLPEYKELHPDFGEWSMSDRFSQMRKDILCMVIGAGEIPVVNLFLSKSLYVLYLPLLLLLCSLVWGKGVRGRLALLLVPAGICSMFAFLSPADFARYAYPSMLLVPALVPLVATIIVDSRRKARGRHNMLLVTCADENPQQLRYAPNQ